MPTVPRFLSLSYISFIFGAAGARTAAKTTYFARLCKPVPENQSATNTDRPWMSREGAATHMKLGCTPTNAHTCTSPGCGPALLWHVVCSAVCCHSHGGMLAHQGQALTLDQPSKIDRCAAAAALQLLSQQKATHSQHATGACIQVKPTASFSCTAR